MFDAHVFTLTPSLPRFRETKTGDCYMRLKADRNAMLFDTQQFVCSQQLLATGCSPWLALLKKALDIFAAEAIPCLGVVWRAPRPSLRKAEKRHHLFLVLSLHRKTN